MLRSKKEPFLTSPFESMVWSCKLYLQMLMWLQPVSDQNTWSNPQQHMRQHARSRKPQISESRFMRTFPSLSWVARSNLYWKALITVCPETNNENKPKIKALMARRSYHKKDYACSLLLSIQKQPHNDSKSSKTVSACKLSKVWGSGEGEAPSSTCHCERDPSPLWLLYFLLSEATPLGNC